MCFDEDEVAEILWMLDEATMLAEAVDALAHVALFEHIHSTVKARFDSRGDE